MRITTWLSRKLLGEPPRRSTSSARPALGAYHAVSIKPGQQSCEAARQMGKLRFLSAKAPRLPLPDCRMTTCTCRYNHYSDRRSGRDRRSGYDFARQQGLNFVNRRESHGRRSTDAVG